MWWQHELKLGPFRRGFHLITETVVRGVPELNQVGVGWLHLFLQHTSASLVINENADRTVPEDLEMAFDVIAPETLPYRHTQEGPDDMPAHVKSALLGCSLLIPVRGGRLVLGAWQGVFLCEHRNHAPARRVTATLQGMGPADIGSDHPPVH